MRRLAFLLVLVTFALANTAHARHGKYRYHHSKHYKHHVGSSTWCQKHPSKCHKKKAGDPKVNTKKEHCMDLKGNYDGYVSGWEHHQFGSGCN